MGCCIVIPQGEAGMMEDMGKFTAVLPPGWHCIDCSKEVAGNVSFRTVMATAEVNAPTGDQADIHVKIGIMYRAMPSKCHLAYYRLSNPMEQIRSFIVSTLRPLIRSKTVDELFEERDELSAKVKGNLGEILEGFGYELMDVLILDLALVGRVRDAMNAMVVNKFGRLVASVEGNISRIGQLAIANANVEMDRLRGVGTAEARNIISASFRAGMENGQGQSNGEEPTESEIMAMMLMLQYYDMISDLSVDRTIFMPMGCE